MPKATRATCRRLDRHAEKLFPGVFFPASVRAEMLKRCEDLPARDVACGLRAKTGRQFIKCMRKA
jgi:hypothetical protein